MNPAALSHRIHGIVPALLVPRANHADTIDWAAFESHLHTVASAGVQGLSVGGATGEYLNWNLEERRELMRLTARAAHASGLAFVPAVGAAVFAQSIELARDAGDLGAAAVLLPPPPFFRYSQEDLVAFYLEAAALSPVPVLLYNLPAFVTPIEPESARFLLERGIAGIKDSSGDTALLASLRGLLGAQAVRLVGNDAALEECLRLGACDGTVSGVAGVLPELIAALHNERTRPLAGRLLGEYLGRCDAFPAPWGLKLTAALRGQGKLALPLPLSPAREQQIAAFRQWFGPWWEKASMDLMLEASRSAGVLPAQ